ncbi:class B sortase [Gordonibacter massiliensis (ex Traore et al. 2017)]|uniref:class B sortase n=1 Tax=Gordonibacter massiliensis (ex Traore et al. 2017) TaxID=1841863 RepID=UPI001C8C30F2|nr:class B sortase [Gordonibacter massiliensis (ex Traore et al. 2017)]
MEKRRPARRRAAVVLFTVLLAVLVCSATAGFGFLLWQQGQAARAVQEVVETPLPALERAFDAPADEPMQNPIDFAALQAENPDVYAWVYVPNTNVNLPVLQRPGDDFYYLDHDRHGEPAVEGAVFSQMANAKDFSDPVTVLYGHNIVNDGMFATLHDFEDPAFFEANDAFYVYVPGRILEYRVVAAYEYDDRHILNSFDFSDPAVRAGYFASVLAPDDPQANVRDGAQLDAESRIVQLSTCRSALTSDPVRYLVTGVLVGETATA